MKKVFFLASAVSILISQTGCFGSFTLTHKLYEANASINNKFLQTIVMYVLLILPAYGGAAFLDIIIFNLIEFWSGSNPLSLEAGQMEEQLLTYKGETYKITATQNKMQFTKIEDSGLTDMGAMVFETEDLSWNFIKDGDATKLSSFNSETNMASIITSDGFKSIDAETIEFLATNKVNSNTAVFAAK